MARTVVCEGAKAPYTISLVQEITSLGAFARRGLEMRKPAAGEHCGFSENKVLLLGGGLELKVEFVLAGHIVIGAFQ